MDILQQSMPQDAAVIDPMANVHKAGPLVVNESNSQYRLIH